MQLGRSLFSLSLAALASQIPSFQEHYEIRLSARIQESKKEIALFQDAAEKSGRSLESYLQFFKNRPEIECTQTARVVEEIAERSSRLSLDKEALQSSSYPKKIFIWLFQIDRDLFQETWSQHRFSLVFDLSTLLFAGAGAFFGGLLSFFWSHFFAPRAVADRRPR